MTNEELILERLDRIETQLAPLVETAGSVKELRDDLIPLSAQAFRLLINELEDIESGFQLEDLLDMIKTFMRSVKTITFSLQQMQNIVDFVTTIEPLLRSSVPQMINYLDDLEQRGVLRMFTAMLDVRAKIASAYTAEDIDKIGDGVVALLGLAKKLSDPQAIAFLEKVAEMPGHVDLSQSKDVGPFGLISAASSKEVKQGLGVMMELTKAMGKLKSNGGEAPAV
ncbi:MAG: DUF1641 domain-containing protein [Planctomycetota bacterium]|jgi:uncharacterized protein YjgD (DUF1641 family)